MDPFVERLAEICAANPTAEKWVVLPSVSIGLSVGERLAREGLAWVNLRFVTSDGDELEGTTLAYEHINMVSFYPVRQDVVSFLKIVTDPNRTPVFVHCQHGADRTGTMCAVYRVAVQGWSKDQAIEEMTQGGFGHHAVWKNLVQFIRELDIDQIKRAAGIAEQDTGSPQPSGL